MHSEVNDLQRVFTSQVITISLNLLPTGKLLGFMALVFIPARCPKWWQDPQQTSHTAFGLGTMLLLSLTNI